MFIIDFLDLFKDLEIINYLFIGFGFYGLSLLLQKILLRKGS